MPLCVPKIARVLTSIKIIFGTGNTFIVQDLLCRAQLSMSCLDINAAMRPLSPGGRHYYFWAIYFLTFLAASESALGTKCVQRCPFTSLTLSSPWKKRVCDRTWRLSQQQPPDSWQQPPEQPQAERIYLAQIRHRPQTIDSEGVNGGRGRDRTYDQSIKSRMLYQLSYASIP